MKIRIGYLTAVLLAFVLPIAAQVGGNGTQDFVPIWAGSNTLGNSTIFETQGMVGIGTTSPTATLHVMGPNGAGKTASATTALTVTGGIGGFGAAGGSISLTSGRGGSGIEGLPNLNAGPGGLIQLSAGSGGGRGCSVVSGRVFCTLPGAGGSIHLTSGSGGSGGGHGGSITLQPGAGGVVSTTSNGPAGNVLLAPNAGNVGIGETGPTHTLEVKVGGTTLADAWTVRSSRRLKTHIQPLQGALEKVEQLQGVSYTRKADGKHEIGVVAEDVDHVVPEVVSRDPKTHEVQGVDYSRLAALLIEAVKSQQGEIRQLKAQIEQLTPNKAGR